MNWKTLMFGKWSWKRPIQSLAAVYILLGLFAVFFADRLMFLPPAPSYPKDLPDLDFLPSHDGETIAYLHLKATPGKPTLLYSHGNAEDIGHSLEIFQEWNSLGFGVVAYDYPGYGHSTGKPTEKSAQAALHTVWNHLLKSGIPATSIVAVGRSIGSGPSCWLAEKENPAGLILLSPFKSIYQVGLHLPFSPFPNDRFPNLKRLSKTTIPLLIIHGEEDEVIPVSHGKALHQASPTTEKHLLLLPHTHHNDIYTLAGPEITQALTTFTQKVTNTPSP